MHPRHTNSVTGLIDLLKNLIFNGGLLRVKFSFLEIHFDSYFLCLVLWLSFEDFYCHCWAVKNIQNSQTFSIQFIYCLTLLILTVHCQFPLIGACMNSTFWVVWLLKTYQKVNCYQCIVGHRYQNFLFNNLCWFITLIIWIASMDRYVSNKTYDCDSDSHMQSKFTQ